MANVLENGLELLVLGMGGVFLFLIIQVILMTITANFFKKYAHLFPDKETAAPVKRPAAASRTNEEIAVAIAALKAQVK